MDDRTRDDTIEEMFSRSSLIVGVAPISSQKAERLMQKMIERGVINRKDPYDDRIQRTIKSMIKTWAFTNQGMTDAKWNEIGVEEISLTYTEGSDIAFIRFASNKDASKFTQKARNLPTDTTGRGPRIVMHVDRQASACYKAFQQIARSLREQAEGTLQTNIRAGKRDFLLRT